MNKRMKKMEGRLLSLLLCIAIVMSFGIMSFAGPNDENDPYQEMYRMIADSWNGQCYDGDCITLSEMREQFGEQAAYEYEFFLKNYDAEKVTIIVDEEGFENNPALQFLAGSLRDVMYHRLSMLLTDSLITDARMFKGVVAFGLAQEDADYTVAANWPDGLRKYRPMESKNDPVITIPTTTSVTTPVSDKHEPAPVAVTEPQVTKVQSVTMNLYDDCRDFSEGLAAVKYAGKWGYIDKEGQPVIPCELEYDFVRDFHDGVAMVGRAEGIGGEVSVTRWGFIDREGKEVIPCTYKTLSYAIDGSISYNAWFENGLAVIMEWSSTKRAYRYFLINKNGEEVFSFDGYDRVGGIGDGLVAVAIKDKIGFLDVNTHEMALPLVYGLVIEELPAFKNGQAAVKGNAGKLFQGSPVYDYGIIDTKGNVIVPFGQYEKNNFTREYSEGLKAYEAKSGWGYMDINGKTVIVPMYGEARDLHEGMLALCIDGKWGFSSVTGLPTTKAEEPSPEKKHDTPTPTAVESTQTVKVDGKEVTFYAYALVNEQGGITNYVKLRDVAALLSGTKGQFEVGWNGSINLETGKPYTAVGGELEKTFAGDQPYVLGDSPVNVNGSPADLKAITLMDANGGNYNYFELRKLGQALGFNVGWSKEKGIFIETDKPYDPNN